MLDCCTRVTTLLECFKWTWNNHTTGQGGGINQAINTKWLKVDFWFNKFLIFKGRVPLHSIIIGIERGIVIVLLHSRLTSSEPYTTWAYDGHTNVSPKILN